jgi:hypothetical protein
MRSPLRIAFAPDLVVAAQDTLAPADIDDDVAVFLALDDTVDDGAGAVLEFLVLALALGFADLLQDHLLGRLRGDPAHVDRRHSGTVADLRLGLGRSIRCPSRSQYSSARRRRRLEIGLGRVRR